MGSRELIGMAAAVAFVAGCDPYIDGKSVVNCQYGQKEGSAELSLPENTEVIISGRTVKSLGNGRVEIPYADSLIIGEDRAGSRVSDDSKTFITGQNRFTFRPPNGIFSPRRELNTITIAQGEAGATKITASFKCDLPQANNSTQPK